MDQNIEAILETVNFIKERMVTKDDLAETESRLTVRIKKLDDRLTAAENKLAGVHNRIDDESLRRTDLEKRVRSVMPNLPTSPQRI